MSDRTRSFFQGIRAELPLVAGVLPFGLIYGAGAVRAGLPPALAQAMSAVVFAGSAQFVTVQLAHTAASALIIVITIAVVNLRHVLYSASIAPYLEHLPLRWRAILAYLLTDEAYTVSIVHFERTGKSPTGHWFLMGAGLALWTTWQVSTALGIFADAIIPQAWPLDFAIPLTFIAMLVPLLRDKPMLAAAASAALVAVLAAPLPSKLGLVLAAVVGIVVGAILERRP